MTRRRTRMIAAAAKVATALGLAVDTAEVLQAANRLAVRLLPCDVLARVADAQARAPAEFEIGLAGRLAEAQAPIGAPDPRVGAKAYDHDGFVVTLWTFYETEPSPEGAEYAGALERLHSCMRRVDMPTPHFTDRILEAQQLVGDRERTPALTDADRELIDNALQSLRQAIRRRRRPEQLLHGEPHPGNVLRTKAGLRFIDFETCCRGPIEFDVAHAPASVAVHYPGVDQPVLHDCRLLMLAMVAAWRWDRNDQFPNGAQAARDYVSALRAGLSGAPVCVPGMAN